MQAAVTVFPTAFPRRRTFEWGRWCEFAAAFVVLPNVVGFGLPPAWWVPALWVIAGLAWLKLRRDAGASAGGIWSPLDCRVPPSAVRHVARRFLFCAAGLVVALLVWRPEHLFDFPRKDPLLWLLIVVLYPVISVYPQELLYRRYFFNRFGGLFCTRKQLALASALVFSWMHLMFRNEAALVLTLIGGWFFADTYRRTQSLRLACFEHALYGNLAFTIGLGEFLYHGSVRL